MRAIVTRPAPQAAEWVARLQRSGIDAVALPLIGIDGPADAAAVGAAWESLTAQRLVVFVSPNAVERFFAERPPGVTWPAATLAAAPGPGTAQALLERGLGSAQVVAPAADAAQFDSDSLWAALAGRSWLAARVLIVRGDGGRDALGDTLRRHGAEVAHLAAYRRVAPRFDAAAADRLDDALARPAAHAWLFSSSEAIDHLATWRPAADWSPSSAIATHPRIAARALRLGVGRVVQSSPVFEAVVRAVRSLACDGAGRVGRPPFEATV